ncbi:MAG TPA: universal stress protein [Coleofasciculaceae cyanobacterium]
MPNKILAALDNSVMSKSVFEEALSLAKATAAHLRLLHVVPPDEETAQDYPIYLTDLKPYLSKSESNLTLVRHPFITYTNQSLTAGIQTEFFQYLGNPGQIICNFALIWESDLIVIGRQEALDLHRLVLGSVSYHVVHHAPCSVHIVNYPRCMRSI